MPSANARGFARGLQSRQRLPHIIALRVDGTGTASILEGSNEVTLVDNGVGDYSLTFGTAFVRVPVVQVTGLTSAVEWRIGTLSASAVQILGFASADGTTATDGDFHVTVHGWDAADEV